MDSFRKKTADYWIELFPFNTFLSMEIRKVVIEFRLHDILLKSKRDLSAFKLVFFFQSLRNFTMTDFSIFFKFL